MRGFIIYFAAESQLADGKRNSSAFSLVIQFRKKELKNIQSEKGKRNRKRNEERAEKVGQNRDGLL